MKKNNKGFSLVELLIALAISGIVLSALVLLIVQAVRTHTKQTALAQIQSDADVTLNQISKNILEAKEIRIDKSGGQVAVYTNKYTATEGTEENILEWGYKYDPATKQLWYTENANSILHVDWSLACDSVTNFDVRLDYEGFTFESTQIKSIPKNPQVVVTIELERMRYKRTVTREFSTRNQVGNAITIGNSISKKEEGAVEDYIKPLEVGKVLPQTQINDYFTNVK